jgi:hypothetical protein
MTVEPFILVGGVIAGGLGVWIALRMRHKAQALRNPSVEAARGELFEHPASSMIKADALILGDVENPLVEITAINEPAHSEPLAVSPAMRTALQPLLQRAPEMLRIGSEAVTKNYRVVFSPAVTRALKDGTLELLPSSDKLLPVARDLRNGKKFVEIGRVVKGGGVKLATVATMSWQVLSIATAQHYLKDINARLAGIERGIDDIRNWLEQEKKGKLSTAVRYLRECSEAISRGQLHLHEVAAIYSQLDGIELTCGSIGDLAREMSRQRLEELDKIEVREWMDRSGSAERAIQWVKHNREALELIFLAQSVRILACHVKVMLPGDHQRVADRIQHAVDEAANAQRLFEATRASLDAKVRDLGERSGNWTALWGKFDDDHRRRIESEFSCVRHQALLAVEKLRTEAASTGDLSNRVEQLASCGLALDVRVDKNGELQILSASAASK